MISETLAGTNAGVSEVTLSDTSSSNPNPLTGATAENPGQALEAEHFASPATPALADGNSQPRQGWWKRRSVESAASGTPLTQVGIIGSADSVKTTTPDVVAQEGHGTSAVASDLAGGYRVDSIRENEDQGVVDFAE